MFYSHEILTSRQYGVATIWLVATIGSKSSAKKITRKAIQDVDVEKACGKILEPGAPIALRLQGNLLYGVSRVYRDQCDYMLKDAQQIQGTLNMLVSRYGDSHLDPEAGQTRPENLTIGNDPAFFPNMTLPKFDLETLVASQSSNRTSSQMSPLASSQRSGSGSIGPGGFQIELDIHHSDSSGPRGSPFGLQGLSSAQKAGGMEGDERLIHVNEEADFPGAEDWGMEIDENGNIVERAEPDIFQDDLELPPLPHIEDEQPAQQSQQAHVDDQGDILMMEEDPLPDAQAFPQRQGIHDAFQVDEAPAQQAAVRRGRKRRIIHMDDETKVPRNELRSWQEDYLQNCAAQKPRNFTAGQAKDNAIHLTFGLGIGNIGQSLGIPGMIHPLAHQFTGDALYTALTGLEVPEEPRGRRRSASEAVGDDEQEAGRRVKPRLDEDNQAGQGENPASDDPFEMDPLLGDSPAEVGREAQDPMSEHLSSAMQLPWNRGSSAVPSSIRAPGPMQKGRELPSSPLGHHGDGQDIVRFSDDIDMGLGDDGLGLGGGHSSQDDFFDGLGLDEGQTAKPEAQNQNESQRTVLGIEGRNFLSFIESAVEEHGERREDDDVEKQRRWVAFDDVFLPRETERATAAQAFYHALCLVTRDQMSVQQDDIPGTLYGGIWLGVRVPSAT
ncbi:R8 protein [Diatrype stigma]|uniref:R8 protein n=1 Tax=Diatrype stigma TaxID=117547 RepID=A0AAN9YQ35_9PEZI